MFVSQMDRSKLYCKSVAITEENFNDSTIFCHISGGTIIFYIIISLDSNWYSYMSLLGAVFHYFIVNMALWWFFHVCSIFYKIMFPMTAKQYEKKEKYFHIVLLVTGKLNMRQLNDINLCLIYLTCLHSLIFLFILIICSVYSMHTDVLLIVIPNWFVANICSMSLLI